ncbi:hypothetical protein [Streptodolium elevatio]|uniref:Uncharacterized protein n=1 Tax=Streptodolium elevatio TaxID=3157996 RepID=A0ABV3D8G4_9ACTN
MFMTRFRFWDYGGVIVEIPVDEPDDTVPPTHFKDVPAHWPRSTVRRSPTPAADRHPAQPPG